MLMDELAGVPRNVLRRSGNATTCRPFERSLSGPRRTSGAQRCSSADRGSSPGPICHEHRWAASDSCSLHAKPAETDHLRTLAASIELAFYKLLPFAMLDSPQCKNMVYAVPSDCVSAAGVVQPRHRCLSRHSRHICECHRLGSDSRRFWQTVSPCRSPVSRFMICTKMAEEPFFKRR